MSERCNRIVSTGFCLHCNKLGKRSGARFDKDDVRNEGPKRKFLYKLSEASMTAQTVALIILALIVAISSPGTPLEVPVDLSDDHSSPTMSVQTDTSDLYVLTYYMQDGAGTARNSLQTNDAVVDGVSPWSWGLTAEGDLRPVYFTEHDLAELLTWS